MSFRLLLLSFLTLSAFALSAQTNVGLEAYYSFDNDLIDRTGNTSNTGQEVGTLTYSCGVSGEAILLDGANDQVRILNSARISDEFDTEDFSLSFYFKPVGINGTQYLFSKRDTACANARKITVTYTPSARLLTTTLDQDELKGLTINTIVDNTVCWQHYTLVRKDNKVDVFLNAEHAGTNGTASRINLETAGPIYIGGGECLGGIETPFAGLMDEVRIYNRALNDDEVKGLYAAPDKIVTSDTIVFLGTSFDVKVGASCGDSFSWTPTTSVDMPTDIEPIIYADDVGEFTYTLEVRDQVSTCVASDSMRVIVVDPNTLPCEVALAKAFTPNLDGLNDTYGISNPYAINNLVSFEIFDRWGAKVFTTDNSFDQWDATFKDERVDPGVFLWQVVYICDGVEKSESGTVTVLR